MVETTTLDIERGQPAIDHVRTALSAGAHVVTANKGPIAFAYSDLARAAQRADRRLLFEGAVMDGIPIFDLVRETLPGVRVTGFRGVVNSTTNFILTAMEQGEPFERALEAMQTGRHCGSRCVARRGRLGRRGEDGGARKRSARRTPDAEAREPGGHRGPHGGSPGRSRVHGDVA